MPRTLAALLAGGAPPLEAIGRLRAADGLVTAGAGEAVVVAAAAVGG